MQSIEITIQPPSQGHRLDKAIAAHCELSRSFLQQLIADGNVFLDGAPAPSPTVKVRAGQKCLVRIPDVQPLALEPVAMDLDIIFEDAHLLVINKPAGLTVHPASSTTQPTLVHGLLAHCASSLSGIGGVARPGIVHRLDKDTSGLMIVAKTDAAHQHLSDQLQERSLSRTYEAVCWGLPLPAAGTIDAPIGRHPKDRIKMAVVSRGGKAARTHYESLERFGPATHLRLKLESGRTHQIRVHMQHIGHGLIGDPVYGAPTAKRLQNCQLETGSPAQLAISGLTRQALHAVGLRFIHPHSGEAVQFSCPLPEDMTNLLSCLNGLQKTAP